DGDGRLDVAVPSALNQDVDVFLGQGDGSVVSNTDFPAIPIRNTPRFADFNGDGAADTLIVTTSGQVLFRAGRVGSPGSFDAPVVVNPDAPARDFAVLAGPQGLRLAVLEATKSLVVFYQWSPASQSFQKLPLTLTTGLLPVRIVAGNINGDGLPDLVVLNVANVDHPLLYLATPQGGFQTPIALSAGSGPTDAALLAGNPMGLDLAIVDQFSADITLLANQGGGSFGSAD